METIVDDNLIWPADKDDAQRRILSFILKVVRAYDIKFENTDCDPIEIANKYLNYKITDQEVIRCYEYWINSMSYQDWRSPFHSKSSLKKRLALCLLFNEERKGAEMTQSLHFFAEVVESLGYDLGLHLNSLTDKLLEPQGSFYLVKLVDYR